MSRENQQNQKLYLCEDQQVDKPPFKLTEKKKKKKTEIATITKEGMSL